MGEANQATAREVSPLEAQFRECFGRVAYTHKTHEKAADLCAERLWQIKWAQIVLSALTSAGAAAVVFHKGSQDYALAALVLSLSTLIMNAWSKELDPGGSAQRHRGAAAEYWNIRERYLSALTDLRSGSLTEDDARKVRDVLQASTLAATKKSPQTNSRAYQKARKALKVDEELTFSSHEIDVMLPSQLRATAV